MKNDEVPDLGDGRDNQERSLIAMGPVLSPSFDDGLPSHWRMQMERKGCTRQLHTLFLACWGMPVWKTAAAPHMGMSTYVG